MKKNKKVIDDKDLNNVSGGTAVYLEDNDKVANNDDNNPLVGITILNNQSTLENNIDPQETIGTNVGKRKIDS